MRKVGLRQMNRAFYDEIKKAPFIITKDKKPYVLVIPYPQGVQNIDEASLFFADSAQFAMKQTLTPYITDKGLATEENNFDPESDLAYEGKRLDSKPVSFYGKAGDTVGYIAKPSLWQRIKNALSKPVL